MCQSQELNLFGQPFDQYSMYWSYFSLPEKRWGVVEKIFNIDDSLSEEIALALKGRPIDITVLPFEWETGEELLSAINSQDPGFSQNIQGDKKLLSLE